MNTTALNADVTQAKAKLKDLKTEQASRMAEGDALVASTKESNPEFNAVLAAAADPESADHKAFLEIDEAYKAADEIGETVRKIEEHLASKISAAGVDLNLDTLDTPTAAKAARIGDRIVASSEYEALLASGQLDSSQRVSMSHINVASRDELGTFLAASDGSGLVPVDQQLGMPVPIPQRQVQLMDLITIAQTDSDAVEYSFMASRTDGTGNVAPGTASSQSDYVWDKATANVRRRAHHTRVLKSQMADAARMRTEIDGELERGVRLHTEAQALAGDGTGENWRGILNTVGISTAAKGADTIPDAVHKGITTVRIALEDDITAIGVHPLDYERYVLAKDGDGRYLSGRGPQDSTVRTMWGYPAIVSTVFTEGTAVAANWAWAYLWLRSGVTIASGYINEQFISDEMTMVAEYRGAFAVKQPKAFHTITGLNA